MSYVLDFEDLGRGDVAVAGGKGAILGELSRVPEVPVAPGLCVTTEAFRRTVRGNPAIDERLAALSRLEPEDGEAIRARSAELRRAVTEVTIPDDVASAITRALSGLGERAAWAVRSSATAEDLPGASFAGQYDSYLDVVGPAAVLTHVSRCWASLFSERAVTYRLRNGFEHPEMAVVVQRMVAAEFAGVLFTADPITGNRRVASVEAIPGLGEALVSGRANPDTFTVRDGELVATALDGQRPGGPTLTDGQVVALVALGRRIEAHLGRPQDIEWCLAEGEFSIVQSRPITTLFPIPAATDGDRHVYVSVGHQQMMTEAMRPLGLSVWQRIAMVPMHEAGGRLFVDVARQLASPETRAGLLGLFGRDDPLTGDALATVVARGDLLPAPGDDGPPAPRPASAPAELDADPAIVAELIERSQASIAALKRDIEGRSGPELFAFLRDALDEQRRVLGDPQSRQVIMAGMQATWWLNEQLEAWLGVTHAADTLTLAVPGNVTSEMGLELLDVADAIRPHADVVEFLAGVEEEGREDDGFLDELASLPGGRAAQEAIRGYLERYGMRGVGEIDITRPRWSERPATLVPLILDDVRRFSPGESARRLDRGRAAAASRERELLEHLRALPDGAARAREAKRMIDRVRTFGGYREYPKYAIVSRLFVFRQALLGEAQRLVRAGVLGDPEDIFFLTLDELGDVASTHRADARLIRERRDAFRAHRALTPPRVLTSDGEVIAGAYRREDVPSGALTGLAVSSGTVEGRARVISDIARADVQAGDILVTTFTDPSWTPVFLSIDGLVTEVGGLMTHGAVIAREYGLPAVVGVPHATELIRDGQRIRVHGTDGYVEILEEPAAS